MDRPAADFYQPRLTWWGRAWRLVLALGISVAAGTTAVRAELDGHRILLVADLVLGLASFVLVRWRRRWPVAVALAINVLGVVSATSAGPGVLATFSLATRRRWSEIIPVGAVSLVAGVIYNQVEPADASGPAWVNMVFLVVFTVGVIGWGMYVGSRRELIWALHQRAERAETEQGLRAQQARSNERSRIAREMHDVLAHRISRISMQAGALAYREDLDGPHLREGAAAIQEQANDALNELRDVLGVLRDRETGAQLDRPQPTYADIPELVSQACAGGAAITLRSELPDPVPEALGRTLYRIIQEGITNATKHAPGAALAVRLAGSPADGIRVELRNPLGFGPSRTPGAGLGLIGLSERTELRGGHLATRVDGPDFVLEGWLPWAS